MQNTFLLSILISACFNSGLADRVQVPRGSIPYQISLRIVDVYFCSGALIDETHVVTSATCAEGAGDFASQFIAVAGDHSIRHVDPHEQVVSVAKIQLHPGFGGAGSDNDVAVLELERAFELNNFVKPIALPGKEFVKEFKDPLQISSWGTSSYLGPISDILTKTFLPPLLDAECRARSSYNVQQTTICLESIANNFSVEICEQDEGSPIVLFGSEPEAEAILVGIVTNSWGGGCGSGVPTINTKVSYYSNWILQFATRAIVV